MTPDARVAASVCDVLSNLEAYRGKIVKIRGVSNLQGAIVPESPSCSRPFDRGGGVWPSAVYTMSTEAYERTMRSEVPFRISEVERRSLEDLRDVVNQLGPDETFEATFVGLLLARDVYRLVKDEQGRPVQTNGFGHLGGYPVALVCQAVEDVSVIKKSPRIQGRESP